jgi:hypothetical protein
MTADPINMSLFDVENVEHMPKVRDMTVGPVSNADVREFSRRYHYTGLPGSASWRWGLWHGPVLHGVVAYNNGTRGMGANAFGDEHANKVWHMGRLMLSDDSPRNSESRLIGGSLAAIERQYPETWAVITFADEEVGHIGTIYQATNALYTGTTTSDTSQKYYVNAEGDRRSWRSVREKGRSGLPGWTLTQASKPKHRYVYVLGSKTQRRQRRALLKLPVLPYPKAAGS